MTHLELPHINILSKIDMLQNFYKDMRYSLKFFTDISELSRIISEQDFVFNKKMANISLRLAQVIEDFSLVTFNLLSVNDKDTMISLARQIERLFGSNVFYIEGFNESLVTERIDSIEERYTDS